MSLIDFIRGLLGTYQAVTYQVYNEALQQYENIIPAGFAGVDWGYVISGALFIVVIYCLLKMLGALICKIF